MQFKWTVEAWGAKWTTNYDDSDEYDYCYAMESKGKKSLHQ